MGASFSVVVNDLHLLWSGVCPSETDPSLVIDSDAVLTNSVALERLESVTGWNAEVLEHLRRSHLTKLAQCHPEDPGIHGGHTLTMPHPLGVLAPERSDHAPRI